jgi:hypothetical protein
MRTREFNRVWLLVALLIPIVVIASVLAFRSYRMQQQIAAGIESARGALQNQLDGAERHNEGVSVQFQTFQIECLKEGLKKLDAVPPAGLSSPVPVFAYVRKFSDQEEIRFELFLEWVETGFEVSGFYVTDKAGDTTDCHDVFSWDGAAKEFLGPSALKCPYVGIITNASDETWWRGQRYGGRPIPYLARLPAIDYSNGEVRLGLLTKAGRAQSTIVVGFLE